MKGTAGPPERLKKAEGRKVFEVKPRVAWDKGKALSYLLGCLGLEGKIEAGEVLSMYFGDDHTDEDAFHELKGFKNDAGCGVIVSTIPKPSNARFSVKDPAEARVVRCAALRSAPLRSFVLFCECLIIEYPVHNGGGPLHSTPLHSTPLLLWFIRTSRD